MSLRCPLGGCCDGKSSGRSCNHPVFGPKAILEHSRVQCCIGSLRAVFAGTLIRMLTNELGVDFRAEKNAKEKKEKQEEQRDPRAKGAVNLRIVRKTGHVPAERKGR